MSDLASARSCDLAVLVPCFAGLPPGLADIVGLLPLRAANEALVQAIAPGLPASPSFVAGVLATDPFLSGPALYRTLVAKGVRSVVNLPSVSPADGPLAQALGGARLGADDELRALAAAPAHGLEPMALVFSHAEAAKAATAGIRHLLLHPGLPRGDERSDRKLAERAAVTLDRLRDKGHQVLLYRHPELEAWLPGDREAPGQLVWRVGAPEAAQPRP